MCCRPFQQSVLVFRSRKKRPLISAIQAPTGWSRYQCIHDEHLIDRSVVLLRRVGVGSCVSDKCDSIRLPRLQLRSRKAQSSCPVMSSLVPPAPRQILRNLNSTAVSINNTTYIIVLASSMKSSSDIAPFCIVFTATSFFPRHFAFLTSYKFTKRNFHWTSPGPHFDPIHFPLDRFCTWLSPKAFRTNIVSDFSTDTEIAKVSDVFL